MAAKPWNIGCGHEPSYGEQCALCSFEQDNPKPPSQPSGAMIVGTRPKSRHLALAVNPVSLEARWPEPTQKQSQHISPATSLVQPNKGRFAEHVYQATSNNNAPKRSQRGLTHRMQIPESLRLKIAPR